MVEGTLLPLIVVCAGGHARELLSYIRDLQIAGEPVYVQGCVDDHRFESMFEGVPILGGIANLGDFLAAHPNDQFSYITAVGDNRTRADVVGRIQRLEAPNLVPWTARHKTATIGSTVTIGDGTRIGPGAVVTAGVTIGEHCIVDANSSVSHNAVLEPFVNINLGASICADVTIGEGCFVGAGATVINDIQVGAWSVIGAGAVVTEDVPAHVTVVGAPARIVQRHGRGARQPMLAG